VLREFLAQQTIDQASKRWLFQRLLPWPVRASSWPSDPRATAGLSTMTRNGCPVSHPAALPAENCNAWRWRCRAGRWSWRAPVAASASGHFLAGRKRSDRESGRVPTLIPSLHLQTCRHGLRLYTACRSCRVLLLICSGEFFPPPPLRWQILFRSRSAIAGAVLLLLTRAG